MTNKNMQLVKRLNISVLKDLICLSGNDYLQIGVLLKYSNHSRTEFARVWPARKWHEWHSYVKFTLYLKKAGLASRNIVHLRKKHSFYVVSVSASIFFIARSLYWFNVYQQDHRSGCLLIHFIRKWHFVQAVAFRIYGSLWEGLLKWS